MKLIEKITSKTELLSIRNFCASYFATEFGATDLSQRKLDEKVAKLLGAKDFNTAIGLVSSADKTLLSPIVADLSYRLRKPKAIGFDMLISGFDWKASKGLVVNPYQVVVGLYDCEKFVTNLLVFVCASSASQARILAEKTATINSCVGKEHLYAESIMVGDIDLDDAFAKAWISEKEFAKLSIELKCLNLLRELKALDWYVTNNDDSYSDFACCFQLEPATAEKDEVTLDLSLSIYKHELEYSISAGINHGEGTEDSGYLKFDNDFNVIDMGESSSLSISVLNKTHSDHFKAIMPLISSCFVAE